MIKTTVIGLLASAALVFASCLNPDPESCSCKPEIISRNSQHECCPYPMYAGAEKLAGIDFEYQCGRFPRYHDLDELPAASADLCATLCAANPSCSSAGWNYVTRTCLISTDTSGETSGSRDFVHLRKSNFISPVEQCEAQIREAVAEAQRRCTKATNAIQKKLDDCKASSGDFQRRLTKCETSSGNLQTRLDECIASSDPACWANGGASLCGTGCTFDEFKVDGLRLRKKCGLSNPSSYGTRYQEPIRNCIQRCSQQRGCVGVQSNPGGTTCWVYTVRGHLGFQAEDSGWVQLEVV